MPLPITYGQAKFRLARITGNGTNVDDARVLEFTNAAIEALMREASQVNPRGVYVGGVDAVVIPADGNHDVALPSAYETALEMEIASNQDINNGWFSDLSLAGLVDPDFAQDALMIDIGYVGNQRVYRVPDAPIGSNVRVMAKKRFVPITGDSDLLLVPNVEAIKEMMISLQKREVRDNFDEAEKYRLKALNSLKLELDGYLMDPTRTLFRKNAYIQDERTYGANTLGYVRARLALDIPLALKAGKMQLTRLIQRAVERLVERTNELRTTGRLRVKTGLSNITYTKPTLPTDVLNITNYELVRTLITAFQGTEINAEQEARAYALLETQETQALEVLRHTTYSTAVQAAIGANQTNTLGYFAGKLALELPDGLKWSDVEVRRMVNEAVREAIQHRNSLSAPELYSNVNGPDFIDFTYTSTEAGVLPYADFSVVRLLFMAQINPAAAGPLKEQAFAEIERNLAKAVKGARNSKWHCLLASNPFPQFGGARAQVGLDYADGYNFSDGQVARMTKQAWAQACDHYNFLGRQEDYQVTPKTVPSPVVDASVIPFSFEIIKFLTEAQIQQDAKDPTAKEYKAQALDAIARDIKTAAESERRNLWQGLLAQSLVTLPQYSFGRVRAQVGLGLADDGYHLPDAKLARMLNEVEETLSRTANFVNGEGEYELGCVDGLVEMPEDVERVIYADICGWPVDIKHRSFEYIGYPGGNGVASNCRHDGNWSWWGDTGLQDRGLSENGNRQYFVHNCPHGRLKVIVKRKWLPKKKDKDYMLVTNLDALRLRIESMLARQGKDLAGAGALMSASDAEMQRQTENHHGAATMVPRINFSGRYRSGMPQLYRHR